MPDPTPTPAPSTLDQWIPPNVRHWLTVLAISILVYLVGRQFPGVIIPPVPDVTPLVQRQDQQEAEIKALKQQNALLLRVNGLPQQQ